MGQTMSKRELIKAAFAELPKTQRREFIIEGIRSFIETASIEMNKGPAIGTRVFAIIGFVEMGGETVCLSLGEGTFAGYQTMPWLAPGSTDDAIKALGNDPDDALRAAYEAFAECVRLNPKIVLDRGGEVWGVECWWCPLDSTQMLEFEAMRGDIPFVEITFERDENHMLCKLVSAEDPSVVLSDTSKRVKRQKPDVPA